MVPLNIHKGELIKHIYFQQNVIPTNVSHYIIYFLMHVFRINRWKLLTNIRFEW